MAIQVPRLQPLDSSPVQQSERINLNFKDSSNAIEKQTGAIAQIAKTGIDIYQKFENEKIDQLSNKANTDYQIWNNAKLQQLKSIQGDATEAYAKYDEEDKKKIEELVSQYPDVSQKVKDGVQAHLTKQQDMNRIHVLKQRGLQQETYDNNLFESSVKLQRDTLSVNGAFASSGDDKSVFDENLNNLKTTIVKQAVKKGTAQVLPDDAKSWSYEYLDNDNKLVKVALNDMSKVRIAKETSEGVSEAIQASLSAGEKDQARILMDKYGKYLDPKSTIKLDKSFQKNEISNKANQLLSEIETKPKDAQISAIEKIDDIELRSKVLEIKASNETKIATLRKYREDSNYDILYKRVQDLKSSNQLYGSAVLKDDKVFKQTFDNLSPTQQRAIMEEVETPKKSDPVQLAKAHDVLLGHDENIDPSTISVQQFQEHLVGLSQGDKSKLITRLTSLQSKPKITVTMYNQASKALKTKLYAKQLAKPNNDKDAIKIAQAQDDLMNYLDEQGDKITSDNYNKYVDKYIADVASEKIFKKGGKGFWSSVFGSEDDGKSKAVSGTSDPLEGLTDSKVNFYRLKYSQKMNKSKPTINDPLFLKFVRENRK